MKTKLLPRFRLALVLCSLIGQVAWVVENMYLNVFIYNIFNASASDISAMVAASAVSAALTTIFIGALSDRIGKRKLFICGGYILWGISIFGFALSMYITAASLGVLIVIALDCLMTFFGSSANDAAFNAWLTDSTDSTNRGTAEGINAMMPLVAILAVFGGFMFFDLTVPASWTWIFAIIGSVVILVGVLGFFIIDDPKTCVASDTGYWKNVIYGFLPSTMKRNTSLYFYLGLFIIFNISIQIFMPYLILYYEVSLGMANYVFIMAPAIILASVATAFWGKVYDKRGFDFSIAISLTSLIMGYVLLFFCKGTVLVFVGSLLMMCGYLCGMAVFGAKIRDLTPVGKAGMLQGVRICSQVLIPGVIGPAIGSAVLANAEMVINGDGTTSFIPNESIFAAALGAAAVLAMILCITALTKKPCTVRLSTQFEENADGSEWANEYPRPQMKRDSYLSLCGDWTLYLEKHGKTKPLGTVRVPFPPESTLSRIGRPLEKHEHYLYEMVFTLTEAFGHDTLLLHFGAVDQIAEVTLNGKPICTHVGGYLPFEANITDAAVIGKNVLRVRVTDTLDTELCYGKQCKKRGGMWYTPISGIWQPVWLENVPKNHIRMLRITPTLDSVTLEVTGGGTAKVLSLETPGGIREYRFTGDRFKLRVGDPILWSPENPHLYHFTLTDGTDTVRSYFALRTVDIRTVGGMPRLCLNGSPYFFHGLLDQGYYSDGIYLPATPGGYRFDIQTMKELGFNTLRKHIKIEPDVFYYECDRLGMIVFQDMVNNGHYSFLFDTALPTIGMKKGFAHRASAKRRADFEGSAKETVALLYNHPSVCYYTIFNEGWGQYKGAERIYDELKAHDPTRIYDTASGWFYPARSDVRSEHVYFKPVALTATELPLVLSEFGGYSCKLDGHAFNLDKTYGYRTCKTPQDLEDALESLYCDEIIPAIEAGLSAAILTQVSDVEDETNGLVTYDRRVVKVSQARMREIANKLRTAHEKAL
ncbi:MAG: MFS transporter [Clostridia bacterium]|nr:MFS transporter [Clostridia bacterium]